MLTEGLQETVRAWLWDQHEALLISLGWTLFILLTGPVIGQFTMNLLILVGGISGLYGRGRADSFPWRGTLPIAAYTLAMSLVLSSGLRVLMSFL